MQTWAVAHGGVVTKEVLDSLGYTTSELDWRVKCLGWMGVGRGAYQVLPPRDHLDAVRAATAVLENAVVSHETAAEVHEFARVSRGLAIVTVHSRTTHRYPGVQVRRAHDIQLDHLVAIRGLRVTGVPRTVVDLAAVLSESTVSRLVDDLVSERRLDLPELDRVFRSIGRRGRPGTAAMRRVLADRIGDDRPQSMLERRGRRILRAAGLPQPIAEYPIPWAPRRRFDDAYPTERVAIEWDSRRFHGQLAAFDVDRSRDRDAALHGWTVLRFTWHDVTQQPDVIVASVRRLLVRTGS